MTATGDLALAEDLAFGEFTGIAGAPASDVDVTISVASSGDEVATVGAPLSGFEGEYLTAVARGTLDEGDDADFGVTVFTADGDSVDLE